uniref:Peroxidase n=1 Tax=Kalanchoe fedtschenkoi TaxID=63787 RepID=A0A7N0TXP0_KALFE
MASRPPLLALIPFTVLLLSSTHSAANPFFGFGWGGHWGWPGSGAPPAGSGQSGPSYGAPANGGTPISSQSSYTLSPHYYEATCPQVYDIVLSVLEKAIAAEPRVAASLLRLHFHDCFAQGCDASVLLDDASNIVSEKNAGPNKNSLRGFEVIDEIKAKLEHSCPHIVSCADIVALAARGSTSLSGGPVWELPLGRKDSLTANINAANTQIPAPNSTLQTLISKFNQQGLDEQDLVALSGGHTIGVARCATFKQRLYNQNGNNLPDATLESAYYQNLKQVCPQRGGDNRITPLDFASPARFDNTYYKLLAYGRGLLSSDEVLYTGSAGNTMKLVQSYAQDQDLFFSHFASSMVKMGNINPLVGGNGQVRLNCRRVN